MCSCVSFVLTWLVGGTNGILASGWCIIIPDAVVAKSSGCQIGEKGLCVYGWRLAAS